MPLPGEKIWFLDFKSDDNIICCVYSWAHGVMEVVFASLAITFLLEIDDEVKKLP
jgi:hypothetical protein